VLAALPRTSRTAWASGQRRCGPKLGQVKTTWIPGYIKGPRDAPLRERPVVYVWRG